MQVDSRWIRTKADEEAVRRGCYVDEEAGQYVVDFCCQFLKHTTGQWKGQPFDPLPWQREEILLPLFGWKRATGKRRFRYATIFVPKKNGKSALCSALSVYLLTADGESVANVYSVARNRKQASIVFDESCRFVRSSPALNQRITITPSKKRMEYADAESVYEVLSADAFGANEGWNISGLIYDELHVANRDLFTALWYGGSARSQPLMLAISTAGNDKHGIGYEMYAKSKAILSGDDTDISHFAYVREALPTDDLSDPSTWRKANPMLGVTIDEQSFAEEYKAAMSLPTLESAFKRYRLNLWQTNEVTNWIPASAWEKCKADYTEEDCIHLPGYMAVDLGRNNDLSACVIAFPDQSTGKVRTLCYLWCPRDCATTKDEKFKTSYIRWAKQGLVKLTEGDVADYDTIREDIIELCQKFKDIKKVMIDPHNASQFAEQLADNGLPVEFFRQGFLSMNEPTKQLERLVLSGKVEHNGNEALAWQIGNVVIATDDADNQKISKKRSRDKVDAVISLVMAIGSTQPEPEFRGVIWI